MSRLGNILTELVNRATVQTETLITSDGEVELYKTGRIVVAHVKNVTSKTIAAWGRVSLGTIPEGMRPVQNMFMPLARQSQTNNIPVFFQAQTGGAIGFVNQGNSSYTTGAIMAASYVWVAGGGS